MYRGKYQKPVNKSRSKKKHGILIISLVLLIAMVVGGTTAYLKDSTDAVENTFTPAKVEITINEDTSSNTKSNITFTNPDKENAVPVYIRATLVIYWKDTINGKTEVIAQPSGGSVDVGSLLNNGWFQVGDIYYYGQPVKPGESTSVMLDTITVTVPEGSTAKCYIDVRAEAIQADPVTAAESAWKDINVINGKLEAAG